MPPENIIFRGTQQPRRHIYSLVQGPPVVRLRTWTPPLSERPWFIALVYCVAAVGGLVAGWWIFRGVAALMGRIGP
jgi:hypothetical protein